jgi:hypothetical protein
MAKATQSSIKSLKSPWSSIRHPSTCFLFFPVNGKKLHWVECPLTSQHINIHVIQHITWSTDQFAVTRTPITIYPVPQTHVSYPIQSKLSEMPLHIPAHQYTCYTAYNIIHRSISSNIDIKAIGPAPKHIYPILSGQWKEITLSGMPLHIPAG